MTFIRQFIQYPISANYSHFRKAICKANRRFRTANIGFAKDTFANNNPFLQYYIPKTCKKYFSVLALQKRFGKFRFRNVFAHFIK